MFNLFKEDSIMEIYAKPNNLNQKICMLKLLCQNCPFKMNYTSNQKDSLVCFKGYSRHRRRYRRKRNKE